MVMVAILAVQVRDLVSGQPLTAEFHFKRTGKCSFSETKHNRPLGHDRDLSKIAAVMDRASQFDRALLSIYAPILGLQLH